MGANDKPSTHEFRQMLARVEIPLDDWTLYIEENRTTILEALAHYLK